MAHKLLCCEVVYTLLDSSVHGRHACQPILMTFGCIDNGTYFALFRVKEFLASP